MRNKISGRTRKIVIAAAAVALAGGAFAISTGVSSAGENCVGLDQALRQNLQFIAGQRANPDAQSAARIANRQAVVDLINQRRAVAGCTADVAAEVPGAVGAPAAGAPAATKPTNNANNAPVTRGVVCKGSTVTLSGEGGAPAASSGTFPVGTRLKVTNLDNNKSVIVRVAGPSGSCVLLNTAAFEQVRQPGKFLVRRAVIERVG
jgi:hypothetical protein